MTFDQFDMTVFLVGTIGGALAELLKWFQLRENVPEKLPAYAKSPFYWIVTVLMALAGGLLAVVQGVDASNLLLALNIGLSAPLILKGLAAVVPESGKQGGGAKDLESSEPSLLNFVAGR